MNNNPSVLVIDDEIQIRKLLNITLNGSGYHVLEAASGKEGLQMAALRPPEIILLDLGLPDADGKSILMQLREWYSAPIIILSVRNAEDEIVSALDAGANDYLVKPFRTGELLARIRSALRLALSPDKEIVIETGNVVIDLLNRTVKKNGQLLRFTATEYTLLSLLARNDNKVLTHQYLLKEVWGPSYVEQTQYLRVFIGQIRRKIEDDPDHPSIIITEPCIGYRFLCD